MRLLLDNCHNPFHKTRWSHDHLTLCHWSLDHRRSKKNLLGSFGDLWNSPEAAAALFDSSWSMEDFQSLSTDGGRLLVKLQILSKCKPCFCFTSTSKYLKHSMFCNWLDFSPPSPPPGQMSCYTIFQSLISSRLAAHCTKTGFAPMFVWNGPNCYFTVHNHNRKHLWLKHLQISRVVTISKKVVL